MSKRAARKQRQATRRAKYGGKTLFGRLIKTGTGIAGGLLTGNVGGALQSLLTSQKVDADGNPTAAQLQQNAQAVQAAAENGTPLPNSTRRMSSEPAPANESLAGEPLANNAGNNASGTPKKDDKNKVFKMVGIAVGVLLLLVIVVKVLTPKGTK